MLNSAPTPSSLQELTQGIIQQLTITGKYSKFQRMYRNDRIAFAYDCLGQYGRSLTFYQEDILGMFDDGNHRVAVRGPHGLGKTFLASILTHHAVLTADDDVKVPTTASSWRQLEKYLWPEIRKIARGIDWNVLGREPYDPNHEMFSLSIKLGGTVEAFAVASDDFQTIEGCHGKRIVYIFDEAKAIPRSTWNAAEGAFSNAESGIATAAKLDGINYVEGQDNAGLVDGAEVPTAIRTPITLPEVYGERKPILPDPINPAIANVQQLLYGALEGGRNSELGTGEIGNLAPPMLPHHPSKDSTLDPIGRLANIHPTTSNNTDEAFAFAISTPGEPSGQFYDIHTHKPGYEDWMTKHVTVEDAIRAGRINASWVLQREKQWGRESSEFQNRVLGEFAETTEVGIIPLSWIKASNRRWMAWRDAGFPNDHGKESLGIDVARGGFMEWAWEIGPKPLDYGLVWKSSR